MKDTCFVVEFGVSGAVFIVQHLYG
jgi:hypothetical protein